MNNTHFYNDLQKLLDILPTGIAWNLRDKKLEDVIEIVLDLGRLPEIRHSDGKIELFGEQTVNQEDINYSTARIDEFTTDNRSGIPGTLHRISAIKSRKGLVIGLTCRIGRVVTGTISCIRDLVLTGKSILFLGKPGVGKTTKLREIARLLADDLGKRVIVVDTSNEIAGDGDIPHEAIGRSRRMQVSAPERQKDVMIEAVENHTPEVIVVDEIGTEQEAMASRTIAERGVMLIATAHGNTLENLIKNPTLSDLVGGVQSVTLGDDEARRRSTQKTVLEREKSPTFDIVIEIIDRDQLAVYPNVSEAVDYILRGWPIKPETRKINSEAPAEAYVPTPVEFVNPADKYNFDLDRYVKEVQDFKKIYIYSVSRSLVDKVIERLNLKAEVTRNIDEADFVISHKGYAKGGAKILSVAKTYGIPMHFVRSNTMPQIQKVIKDALGINEMPWDKSDQEHFDETEAALQEAKTAVYQVLNGASDIELPPRKHSIRRLQHEFVEQHNLESESIGDEPNRRLKVISGKDKDLKNAG
ncbi:MAG: AAA family ATPase [Candidatus Gastranaerophilales bacterium]|nr:AAA family ATPase [Candidatus Gastranaerophilales bacterium]